MAISNTSRSIFWTSACPRDPVLPVWCRSVVSLQLCQASITTPRESEKSSSSTVISLFFVWLAMTVNGNINRLLPNASRDQNKHNCYANHLPSLADQPLLVENVTNCSSRTVATDTQWASLVLQRIEGLSSVGLRLNHHCVTQFGDRYWLRY